MRTNILNLGYVDLTGRLERPFIERVTATKTRCVETRLVISREDAEDTYVVVQAWKTHANLLINHAAASKKQDRESLTTVSGYLQVLVIESERRTRAVPSIILDAITEYRVRTHGPARSHDVRLAPLEFE